jgi:hypothetical protein
VTTNPDGFLRDWYASSPSVLLPFMPLAVLPYRARIRRVRQGPDGTSPWRHTTWLYSAG